MAYFISHADPSNWGPAFTDPPTYIILHGSGSDASEDSELRYLMSRRDKPFGYHFLVMKSGDIHELCPVDRVAWHAGESSWDEDGWTLEGLNKHSWGVGFSSDNREDPITTAQINAAIWLRTHKLKVEDRRVLTHKDISYPRKTDADTLTLDQLDAVRRRLLVYDTLVVGKDVVRKPFVFSTNGTKLQVRMLGDERI